MTQPNQTPSYLLDDRDPTTDDLRKSGLLPEVTQPAAPAGAPSPELTRIEEFIANAQKAEVERATRIEEVLKRLQPAAVEEPQLSPEEEETAFLAEFLATPKTALKKLREQEAARATATEEARKKQDKSANDRLKELVPNLSELDKPEVAQAFEQWRAADSFRSEVFELSGKTRDVDARAALLKSFLSSTAQQNTVVDSSAAARTLFSAGSVNKAATAKEPAPVFRRSELITLKQRYPEQYAAREAEILKAYAEGRVK